MAKDPYLKGAQAQFDALREAEAEARRQIEGHRRNKDWLSLGEAEQQLADVRAAGRNLSALVQEYAASQQAPPELSPEEKAARPIERMDYRDAFELAQRGSKYGVDVDAFNEGLREVARRRARGE